MALVLKTSERKLSGVRIPYPPLMIRQQVKRSLKMTGDQGEVDVVEKIVCPNCGKKMSQLPNSFPLYDLQCTACNFRAQVKSSNSSNKKF